MIDSFYSSDIDENVRSLSEFTTDLVIEASVRCIQTITGVSLDLPMSLPPGMSARFRLGTSLANSMTVSSCNLIFKQDNVGQVSNHVSFRHPLSLDLWNQDGELKNHSNSVLKNHLKFNQSFQLNFHHSQWWLEIKHINACCA